MKLSTNTFLKTALVTALFTSSAAFAAGPTTGQLMIVNSLGNVVSATGNPGATPSAVSIEVKDSGGTSCTRIANVVYNGTALVKWNDALTASTASACKSIGTVEVTPLKAVVGGVTTIIYDSSAATTIPAATATSAIVFTAPTTAYANQALIINGSGVPASAVTVSATAWGVGAASAPAFAAGNGALATVGVPGAQGTYGLKAEKLMRQFAVLPFQTEAK